MDLGKDADIDFNIVSSVFGKRLTNVVDWINKGLATYIDKEKALSFLSHQSAPIAEAAANEELDSATKVVKDFESPPLDGRKIDQKEKALRFIEALPTHPRTTITNEEPDSATKVVKGFENQTEREGNNTDDHDEIEQ